MTSTKPCHFTFRLLNLRSSACCSWRKFTMQKVHCSSQINTFAVPRAFGNHQGSCSPIVIVLAELNFAQASERSPSERIDKLEDFEMRTRRRKLRCCVSAVQVDKAHGKIFHFSHRQQSCDIRNNSYGTRLV